MGMNWGWKLDGISLWKALNINAGGGRGWCPLCRLLFWSSVGWLCQGVQDGDGARWTSPWVLSPNFHFAVGIGYGIPMVYELCFSCRLHAPAQVHEVTFFGFEHMNGFLLLSSDPSWGLCQRTAPVPHNPPLMMGIRWWDTAVILTAARAPNASGSQSHQEHLGVADEPASLLLHHPEQSRSLAKGLFTGTNWSLLHRAHTESHSLPLPSHPGQEPTPLCCSGHSAALPAAPLSWADRLCRVPVRSLSTFPAKHLHRPCKREQDNEQDSRRTPGLWLAVEWGARLLPKINLV